MSHYSFSSSRAADDTLRARNLLIARIQLADLDTPSASIIRLEDVSSMEEIHPITFLDLPAGYGINTEGIQKNSMTARMLRLMVIEQWRGQEIPSELQADHEASLMLMLMLVKHHGYTSIVAGIDDSFDKSKINDVGGSLKDMSSRDDLDESIGKFFDTLIEGGWNNGSHVYLVRPTSDTDLKPFEMVVHRTLAGWKLPADLISAYLESARQRADQAPGSRFERQAT